MRGILGFEALWQRQIPYGLVGVAAYGAPMPEGRGARQPCLDGPALARGKKVIFFCVGMQILVTFC